MRPEDETPDVPPTEGEDGAGEQEAPPPATWAGRRRAEGEGPPPADAEPDTEGETDDEDDPATGDEPDVVDEPVAAEAADDEPVVEDEPVAGDEPVAEDETPRTSESDEVRAGFTEEFDEIERDLADELREIEALDDAEQGTPGDESQSADEDEEAEAPSPDPGETVEAETLALADAEEAEEAAMAGLRARTAEHEATLPASEATPAPEAPAVPPVPVATAESEGGDGEKVPRAKPLWARFLAASLVIVISMAAATAISLLVYLTEIAEDLGDNDALATVRDQLEEVDGGAPQTILILGSDKRLDTKGDPGRSDTTILLRVDPEKEAIALLSIPRDLRVTIPKVGVGKFNEAYTAGGPELTLEVVKRLTGLEVNHVVNINFTGFADAVNAIDCVYIDVDRRYYIPPESGTSEIDIEAGYQRLCGFKALQYVRFRHLDNDLVRSARQQDFMREARQKLPPGKLIEDRNELLDIFTEYTTSDIGDAVTLLELLKTFLACRRRPCSEVHFPADLGDGHRATSTRQTTRSAAVDQFLGVEGTPGERPAGEPAAERAATATRRSPMTRKDEPKRDGDGEQRLRRAADGRLDREGQPYANQMAHMKTKGGDR